MFVDRELYRELGLCFGGRRVWKFFRPNTPWIGGYEDPREMSGAPDGSAWAGQVNEEMMVVNWRLANKFFYVSALEGVWRWDKEIVSRWR